MWDIFKIILLLSVLTLFTAFGQAEEFKPVDIEITANSGVKFYSTPNSNQTHRDLYAIPSTKEYRGWKITQIGEPQSSRSPVKVCHPSGNCYSGWVPTKWARPTQNKPLPLISNKTNTPNDSVESSPKPPPQCLGIVKTTAPGLALRSVHRKENRINKGEPLNCGMNQDIELCITDANNDTGQNSWVEAVINNENFERLNLTCKRNLDAAVRDGLIVKNENNEYIVSFYTNPIFVSQENSSDGEKYLNKELLESEPCKRCEAQFLPGAEKVEAQVNDLNAIALAASETSEHPEGWPVSADGYSYPIDPSKSYITSGFGLRNLHGRLDYHEGFDFGTLNKVIGFHAMREGEVISVKMNCDAKSSENCNGGYGNQIQVRHSDGTTMFYSHLHANCKIKVSKGQKIGIGDKMGCVGYSGRGSTHLDVRQLKKEGNPYKFVQKAFDNPKGGDPVTLTVSEDFESLEPKLQSLYSHIIKKKDMKNPRELQLALANRWDYINSLEEDI